MTCAIYESRPLVCRVQLNMDQDSLLCELVEGQSIPVPYANSTVIQALYMQMSLDQKFGDIREYFQRPAQLTPPANPPKRIEV
jgi:hypothetical protein